MPDLGDDIGFGLLLFVGLLVMPFLFVLVIFSVEIALLLVVLPLLMAGQVLGLLPWVLTLTTTSGNKRHTQIRGTRAMLEARTAYRAMCVR